MLKRIAIPFCLMLALSQGVHASLIDNLDGTVTDDSNGLMWLQDANLAGSTMSWNDAVLWAENLVYAGYDDWRLPSAGLMNPTSTCESYDGSCDRGYNITRDGAELANLYNDLLGNPSYYDSAGHLFGADNGWAWPGNNGPFDNVQVAYWLEEEYSSHRHPHAWYFSAYYGQQSANYKDRLYSTWAVRDGEVNAVPVPVPGTLALLGVGLAGLGLSRRRRNP